MAYMSSDSFGTDGGEDTCFLCAHGTADDDEAAHVVYRGRDSFVVLNAYPYNTGHVMIAPKRHVGDLSSLGENERAELMELITRATVVIKEVMGAQGFNVGINQGQAAGAGVPGHLHVHVVPRWGGDTNFMPVVGETKVLPEMLADTYAKLRPAFSKS
ncbi:MAG: adenylyltransferase [Actinomycetota bacterium]|jgi:ATP adenylyltransferase|nr:adenylyltransferase [Actinomycetota bacterium]